MSIVANPHFVPFHELKRIIYGEPEKVRSRFNASYATILNLYEKHGEEFYDIYPRSFHYFREKKKYQERALLLLHSKVKILKQLGYIKDGALTEKGAFAGKIYGYELSLSELYEEGVLEHLSEMELGILSLALVFEPRRGTARPHLGKRIKGLENITDDIVRRIQKTEKKMWVVPLSKAYSYELSHCLEAWMNGEDFEKMLPYGAVDEGEIIRYFRMTIQILREILDTRCSSMLKEKGKKAIHLINRGIIDAEKQLRS